MKYCQKASTIEIKTQDTKNTLCACKMIICASWWLFTAIMLNKVRFLMSALSLI